MIELIRIRCTHLLLAAVALVAGCTHRAPAASPAQAENRIIIHEESAPIPAGTRFAIQINNEPPIIHVADGRRDGPPFLYHGHELKSEQVKSLIILKGKEARERFGDSTLEFAMLIELK
jgi:hypothetical protein